MSIIINAAPVVSGQPTNQTTCAGTAKTFSVTASGTSPTYQWQYSPDNGVTPFVNVANGTPPNITYTNATTATLTVAPSGAAANGTYYYRCVVSVSGCVAPATSNSASLQVYATPTTANAGADQTICSTTTSTVLTANTPSIGTGTWSITSGPSTLLSQFNDTHDPAAVFTPAVTTSGTYALVWTIANGTCTSSSDGISIIVNAAPVISGQPVNQITCPGATPAKTFTVTLSAGTSPSYQWQYSPDNGITAWVNVANGTPSGFTYTISSTTTSSVLTTSTNTTAPAGIYYYRCVIAVTNCSSLNSNSASLTVNPLPTASSAGGNQTLCSTPGTTTLAANTPIVGTGAWSVDAGSPNTSLSQFGNTSSPTSSFTPVGGAGIYTLRWTITSTCGNSSSTVAITVRQAPAITANPPATAQTCAGTPVSFSASGTGTGATYTWQYFNGSVWNTVAAGTPAGYAYSSSVSGTASTLTVTPPTTAPNAIPNYRLNVSVSGCESAPPANSSPIALTVYAQPSAANAGIDQNVSCGTLTTTLGIGGTAPTSGTGVWTYAPGSPIGSIANPNQYNTTFTGTPAATYTLRWTVSNGTCASSFDDVTINFNYSLSGSYTVGVGGQFITLSRAIDNYNRCLAGNVTFLLINSSAVPYTAGEGFPIVIDNPTASSTRTLTIKPNAGVNPLITGSSTSALIKFNGADFITIDGSNNGTTSQNLTITNTYVDNDQDGDGDIEAVTIWIASKSTSDGAGNNTIKNCKINGSSSSTSYAGIVGADNVNTQNFADAPNNNNTIQNCTIANTNAAVIIQGATTKDQNWLITNNTLGVSSTNDLTSYGIYINYADIFNITNNTISNVVNLTFAGSTAGIAIGGNTSNFSITGNQISNVSAYVFFTSLYTSAIEVDGPAQAFTISNNVISNVSSSPFLFATAFYNTNGITIFGGATASNAVQSYNVSNNNISAISGSIGQASVGIEVSGQSTGTNNINSNNINNISQSGVYGSEGILLNAGTNAGLTVYNNFISNIKSAGDNGTNYNDNGYGIMVNSGSGYKIFYNTVNLQANQNTVSGSISAAINISSSVTATGAIDLKDNILSNNQNGGVIAANRYSIYSSRTSNNIFNGTINYNDYYTTGANLGFINGNNRTTIVQMQAGFGGNTNSVNTSPVFVNAGTGDLHLDPASNSTLDNLGTSITGITIDIDAQTRNPVTPDIGADEFNSCSPALVSWLGGTNNDWNTGSNWCAGVPPTISQNVIIPAGTTFQPVISLANANALSLTIASGANLTMSSTFNLNLGAGSIFANNGTFAASASTGTVIFSGAGSIAGNSATTFNNVTINGSLTVSTSPTINGNFTINTGAVSAPLTYGNNSTLIYNIPGAYSTTNDWYDGAGGTTTAGLGIPNNVIIQNGGNITLNTGVKANRALAGNLIIGAGSTFQLAAGANPDLYILGNWTNNGSFNANGKTVTFNKTSGTPFTQAISGTTTFYNLTFGNSNVTTDFGSSINNIQNNFRNDAGSMNGNTSNINFTGTNGAILGAASKFFYNLSVSSGNNVIDNVATTGDIHISNSFINNGSFSQYYTHTTYFDKSNVSESMSGSGTNTVFGNLTIGGPVLSLPTALNANTLNFTISGNALTFNSNSSSLTSNGAVTFSRIIAGNSSIQNASGVSGTSASFKDLLISIPSSVVTTALNPGNNIALVNNSLTINNNGSVITNAPNYSSSATLIYNTASPIFTSALEWNSNNATPGLGVPQNVSVTNTNSVVIASNRTVPGTLNLTAGSLDIGANHTLAVNGGFTGVGGNLKGSTTSNLIAGGTGTINFNAAANYLKDLTINNSANLALGSALNITASNGVINSFGTVTVNSGATLNAASTGYLTLKSDVYGDARVGNSAGTLSGNVTVERYMPPRRAWRFLGAPFSSSTQSINAAWQEGQTLSTLNCPTSDPTPAGLGTEITNNNTGNGYDLNITTNPSIKTWVNNTWTTPVSTLSTNIVSPYQAYCLFVRGDRQICLVNGTSSTPNPTILRAKGILSQVNGNPLSLGFSGANVNDFIFVANPYASAIDLSKTGYVPSNTNPNFFYVWDPKIGGTSGVGAYVVYSFASGTWSDNSGSYSSTNLPVIQSGQAFMVQATGTSGSVGFTENNKTLTEFNVNGRRAPAPVLFAELTLPADSLKTADGVAVTFDSRFSKGFDEFDAPKNWNFVENMALQRGANYFAVEARPLPQLTDTIFFKLYLKQQPYALKILSQGLPGNFEAWLVDKYLNTKTEVNLEDTTLYNFTPNTDTNSYRNRFMLVFNRQLQTTPVPVSKLKNQTDPNITGVANSNVSNESSITIAPNPVITAKNALLRFNNITKGFYEITVYNSKGQKLGSEKIQHDGSNTAYHLPSNASWAAGLYSVTVLNQITKQLTTLKLIISK